MGEKMCDAPLYYALAQVKFNPIMDLENYIPIIQAKMRQEDFPDFKNIPIAVFGMNVINGFIRGSQPSQYIFGDISEKSSFIIGSDFMSYQTTYYDEFDDFLKSFLKGLTIIHNELSLKFIERIGLRYLNAVMPDQQGSFAPFLVPEALGLRPNVNGKVRQSFNETVIDALSGPLILRVITIPGAVGMPADLEPLAPKIDARFTGQEQVRHAVIDMDAVDEKRRVFDLNALKDQLGVLHRDIRTSFEAIVTPQALAAWQ